MEHPWWWVEGPPLLFIFAVGVVVGYIWGLGDVKD